MGERYFSLHHPQKFSLLTTIYIKKMDGRARVQSQPELNGEFTPNLGITFKLTVAVIKHLSKASSICLLIEPRGVLTHSGLSPPPLITN